jgi:hypothetical protein
MMDELPGKKKAFIVFIKNVYDGLSDWWGG